MRYVPLFILLIALLSGANCVNNIDADEATYQFVEPDWSKYWKADTTLTPEQKARRQAVLDSWKKRIEKAKE